jgi:hypothetical protein
MLSLRRRERPGAPTGFDEKSELVWTGREIGRGESVPVCRKQHVDPKPNTVLRPIARVEAPLPLPVLILPLLPPPPPPTTSTAPPLMRQPARATGVSWRT